MWRHLTWERYEKTLTDDLEIRETGSGARHRNGEDTITDRPTRGARLGDHAYALVTRPTRRERERDAVPPKDGAEIASTHRGGLHLHEDFTCGGRRDGDLDDLEGALSN